MAIEPTTLAERRRIDARRTAVRTAAAQPTGRRPTVSRLVYAWLALATLACGGGAAPTAEPTTPSTPPPAAPDTRTAIERRRDAACDQLGPKLTACAVEDARASLTAGKIDQAQYDRDTAPAIQRKNTDEFDRACKSTTYSSRQIRVLEVCFQQEPACASLLDCLGHLSDAPKP